MNTGLNENEPELGVLVLPELLEVLPHGDGLLNEVVEILRELGGKTYSRSYEIAMNVKNEKQEPNR